jgi:hypothetical protein
VVFGEVINDVLRGDLSLVNCLFDLYSDDGRPKKQAEISDCGVISES